MKTKQIELARKQMYLNRRTIAIELAEHDGKMTARAKQALADTFALCKTLIQCIETTPVVLDLERAGILVDEMDWVEQMNADSITDEMVEQLR